MAKVDTSTLAGIAAASAPKATPVTPATVTPRSTGRVIEDQYTPTPVTPVTPTGPTGATKTTGPTGTKTTTVVAPTGAPTGSGIDFILIYLLS